MGYKIVKNEEAVIRKPIDCYTVKNYLTKEFNEEFSLAVSELNGSHELTKIVTDRTYYFIEADAEFIIEGNSIKVKAGDTLFIKSNTEYSFSGNFKAVMINVPAFGLQKDFF